MTDHSKTHHNYIKKIGQMIARGQISRDAPLTELNIYHDHWCGIYQGELCNCNPDIEIIRPGRSITWQIEG